MDVRVIVTFLLNAAFKLFDHCFCIPRLVCRPDIGRILLCHGACRFRGVSRIQFRQCSALEDSHERCRSVAPGHAPTRRVRSARVVEVWSSSGPHGGSRVSGSVGSRRTVESIAVVRTQKDRGADVVENGKQPKLNTCGKSEGQLQLAVSPGCWFFLLVLAGGVCCCLKVFIIISSGCGLFDQPFPPGLPSRKEVPLGGWPKSARRSHSRRFPHKKFGKTVTVFGAVGCLVRLWGVCLGAVEPRIADRVLAPRF